MSSQKRSVPRSAPTITVSHHAPGLRNFFLIHEVVNVAVEYSGALGARTVSEPILISAEHTPVSCEFSADAKQEFRELCTALLEARFPSWADGEGSEGRFSWHLESDRLRQAHELRISEAQWEEWKVRSEFELDCDTSDLHIPF